MERIFIQIASYRDPELAPTIESLIKNADYPDRLTFGICWQHSNTDEFEQHNQAAFRPGFRVLDVPYQQAKGVCWARAQIGDLYHGEEYTLQIDSHMRFRRHWDTLLINLYNDIKSDWKSEKPIITAYPPAYEPGKPLHDSDLVPLRIVFNEMNREGQYSVRPEGVPNHHLLRKPFRARFYAAGFAFTTGKICEEVPHDPNLYFIGEEMNIAARAFTWGYDLFHPHFSLCWHYYVRSGSPRQWTDQPNNWGSIDIKSKERSRQLFGYNGTPRVDFGKYGFGPHRTLEEYEQYVGVEFGPIPKIHQSLLLWDDPVMPGDRLL